MTNQQATQDDDDQAQDDRASINRVQLLIDDAIDDQKRLYKKQLDAYYQHCVEMKTEIKQLLKDKEEPSPEFMNRFNLLYRYYQSRQNDYIFIEPVDRLMIVLFVRFNRYIYELRKISAIQLESEMW